MKKNKNIDISSLNDKCVRVKTIYGEVLEGICTYNGEEYDEHEYGVAEDGLDVAGFLIYRSQIEEAVEIGEDGFSAPYGWVEEEILKDGFDFGEDVFFSDFYISELRMLNCIEDKKAFMNDPETKKKAIELFDSLVNYSEYPEVREKAKKLYGIYTEWSKA